jgi:putative FmdB family regulatory protein
MPVFEYECKSCQAEFEEILTQQDDIKKYANWHLCPGCGTKAQRLGISVTNFNFKGGVRGESGVHGQSGVHDLDYPKLDKAIGRSANKRWERINKDQTTRDKIRKDTKSDALAKDGNTFIPASTSGLQIREMGLARYLVEKRKDPT